MQFYLALTTLCSSASAISKFAIPQWDLQSTEIAGNDLESLSIPDYDSSFWYCVSARTTVFAGLIEAGIYETDQLFYSNNLQETVDYTPYYVPWLYRTQLPLQSQEGRHYFLQTNGITSKADICLNGHEVADKTMQTGCYGGHEYDITPLVGNDNALLIRAWPTSYDEDFAMGFVDWNPYPPDNGTGVWRDVFVKETGPLSMGPVRIVHDYVPGNTEVEVELEVDATNLENDSVTGALSAVVGKLGSDGRQIGTTFRLGALETRRIRLSVMIEDAKIWWPALWGEQPLYSAQMSVSVNDEVSDVADAQSFGIRRVTSRVNEHNDTIFSINGQAFQIRGAGYSSDIFMRWDEPRFRSQMQHVLDMGLNTIRLEGKQEHPELYDIADEIGLMVMAGWECCDKWEAWSYNEDVTATHWDDHDYYTANISMRHEGAMMQTHPCMLAFLVGSDYWPDERATDIYVNALNASDWQNPIIASAAKRSYPKRLGPSGLKMEGPYDWVPPNYWYGDQLGAAFGFGSELGAGVGTPEIGSLKKFLSSSDMEDLWTKPRKGMYHMSTNASQFFDRTIYNKGLWARYGEPKDLEDYLLKAQMTDYEATRSQFEAYSAKWNAERPATGLIYWMLNNAWPSLHWNLFDYYLHPAGSYFGAKVGNRVEHVAYDYETEEVWLINHSLDQTGSRKVDIEVVDLEGNMLGNKSVEVETEPNTSKSVSEVPGLDVNKNVAFLRLCLTKSDGEMLSRNVYWLPKSPDVLDWDNSSWYHTPVEPHADMTALQDMGTAAVSASVSTSARHSLEVVLENESRTPAFFIRLNLVDAVDQDINPVTWSDNYITLLPYEKLTVRSFWPASNGDDVAVHISGGNIGAASALSVR